MASARFKPPSLHHHECSAYCTGGAHAVLLETAAETAYRGIWPFYENAGWEIVSHWETKEAPISHPARNRRPIQTWIFLVRPPEGTPIGDQLRLEHEQAGEGQSEVAC